jgi:hypothetical protein
MVLAVMLLVGSCSLMRCCLVRITDMVFAPHLMMVFRPHLTPMVFGPPLYCHGLSSPPEQIVPVVEEFVSGLGCVYSPAVCQAITPPSKLALMPIELFVLADPEYRICDTTCGDSQVRHTSLSLPGQTHFSLTPRSGTLLTHSQVRHTSHSVILLFQSPFSLSESSP